MKNEDVCLFLNHRKIQKEQRKSNDEKEGKRNWEIKRKLQKSGKRG